jgi:hypothetical protein
MRLFAVGRLRVGSPAFVEEHSCNEKGPDVE